MRSKSRHDSFVLNLALLPSVAFASYKAGFAGVLYLLMLLPIGVVGILVTLVLTAKKQFRKPQVFSIYALT